MSINFFSRSVNLSLLYNLKENSDLEVIFNGKPFDLMTIISMEVEPNFLNYLLRYQDESSSKKEELLNNFLRMIDTSSNLISVRKPIVCVVSRPEISVDIFESIIKTFLWNLY